MGEFGWVRSTRAAGLRTPAAYGLIRGPMADRRPRYDHGPGLWKLQARYRDLITTQEKMSGRRR